METEKAVIVKMETSEGETILAASEDDPTSTMSTSTPASSTINCPVSTPSGHRSRKEKLVVRSFSTEIDEIQPRILSHEEFYGSASTGKRGLPRNRRTASAPSPSKSRSREQTPSDEEDDDDKEKDGLVSVGALGQEHQDGGGGGGSSLATENHPIKKYRKRKVKKTSPTEEQDQDFQRVDVVGGQDMDKKGSQASNYVKQRRNKSHGKVEKSRKDKEEKKFKRRLEGPSYQENDIKRPLIGRPPKSRKSSVLAPTTNSSCVLKTSPKYARRYISPNSNTKSSTTEANIDIGKNSNPNTNKSKVTFMDQTVLSPVISPTNRVPAAAGSSSSSPAVVQLTQPPTPPRKLVHYKVPERFANIMGVHNKAMAAAVAAEGRNQSMRAYFTSTTAADSSSEKDKNIEGVEAGEQSLLLPPPPPPPSSNSLPSSSLFTAPTPPDSATNHLTPTSSTSFTSQSASEGLVYCKEKQEADYAAGRTVLQDMMANYTNDNGKLSFTVPDWCKESIAKLVSALSISPILSKKKKGPRDADKDSSSSDSGLEPLSSNEKDDDVGLSGSVQQISSYGRKLVRKTDKTEEINRLLHETPRTSGQFQPSFVMGSYIGPARRTVPKLTVGELEVFQELMTPDDNFMLSEDEQELANLYCEMVGSQLKEIQRDRERKTEMKSLVQDLEGDGTAMAMGPNGRKIADAYPIMVKPENRHLYPAEWLMKQEDFVILITKGKENQLKELNTRHLRTGKEVSLKKIRLPWTKSRMHKKKKAASGLESSGQRHHTLLRQMHSRKDAVTLPAAKVGGTADLGVKNNSMMKLRDGKEIPHISSMTAAPISGMFHINMSPVLHGGSNSSTVNGGSSSGGRGALVVGKGEIASPPKPDEYSQRVEASLKRLEAGTTSPGELLDFNFSSYGIEPPTSSSSSNNFATSGSVRCRTQPLVRINELFLNPPSLLPGTSTTSPTTTTSHVPDFFNFSGYNQNQAASDNLQSSQTFVGSDSSPVTSGSPYMFKPIQPYPITSSAMTSSSSISSLGPYFDPFLPRLSSMPQFSSINMASTSPFSQMQALSSLRRNGGSGGGSGSGSSMSVGSPLLISPLKNRYSRQKHSTLCPPFDNNHCSYNYHHCSYPRAPNSRFCIHHVDEGATVNFERCKYVKGSRECGRFIPRSSSQGLFCDIHALTIANAHIKKSRSPKPLDKTEGLVKHLRCNLDRAEGKIMEPDGLGSYCVRKDFLEDDRDTFNNSSNSDESDDASTSVGNLYKAQKGDDDSDVDDCDAACVDGNVPDYSTLKTAGYYTVEECVKMSRAALVKLQECMVQEMDLLKRQYINARKSYNQKCRFLRTQGDNFTTDPKLLSTDSNPELTQDHILNQVKMYNDTMSMLAHRKNTGPRSLLRQSVLRRRQQLFESYRRSTSSATGGSARDASLPLHPAESKEEIKLRLRRARRGRALPCSYGSGTREKCKEWSVPLSQFCFKHITQDKFQKLYTQCNFRLGPDSDDVCNTPVLSELDKFGCSLHALPIPLKDPPESQNKKAKVEEETDKLMEEPEMDSSGDEEDVSTVAATTTPQTTSAATGVMGNGEADDLMEQEEQAQLLDHGNDEEIVHEMEHLVGDEVVDIDHFRETLTAVYNRGLYNTDSEESEDTDEEETEDFSNSLLLPQFSTPNQ